MAIRLDYEELEAMYKGMSLSELARAIRSLKIDLEEKAEIKTRAQKLYDHITMAVVPDRMDEENVQTMKVPDVGRLQVASSIRCSCPAGNREALYQWLRDHNHGAMINPTINSSTLKAFVVEQMKAEDGNYPEELLKVEPYSRATVVQS